MQYYSAVYGNGDMAYKVSKTASHATLVLRSDYEDLERAFKNVTEELAHWRKYGKEKE